MIPTCRVAYPFAVVVKEGLDRVREIGALVGDLEVDGEVDAVEIAVQQEGLAGVEGEAAQHEAETAVLLLRDLRELFGDPARDDLVGFGGGCWRDQVVEGEDAA